MSTQVTTDSDTAHFINRPSLRTQGAGTLVGPWRGQGLHETSPSKEFQRAKRPTKQTAFQWVFYQEIILAMEAEIKLDPWGILQPIKEPITIDMTTLS